MRNFKQQRRVSFVTAMLVVSVISCFGFAKNVGAASWNGIEPFKTSRAEVLKIMGPPVSETTEGVLRFNVSGGSVQISFVNEKFVANKKLRPELAGAVLEIVLQHEHSSDTAESMKLLKNRDFSRDDVRNISIFRNIKDGVVYTFIDGRLKTTRYTFADSQLSRARR
ncbi:MAG TPA: hypothetical protein VN956_05405 [Pyrinomonadaceae bacterium]|nr:hypothetical protein [Pyrinomonadaceae bacterium]